ncbi:MAG: dimethylsulfoniopropionate lyase [Acidiferrobacterales bacterium]|nr:dimethylsulfoniopropionate lyase [Acidiferrobacterales bacterium]
MTEQPGKEAERALHDLASGVVKAIQSRPDILHHQFVKVPDFSAAICDPHTTPHKGKTEALPQAYRFVDEIVALGRAAKTKEILAQFYAARDLLIWGHAPGYNVDTVGQTFLDNYCHALLTGPDGPLRCHSPLGAFVLFGPNTLYKDHSHAPNEVYLALTDGGQWRVGNRDWQELDAGETIFIPSESVHAIRTSSEPLLTFSFWLEPGEMNSIAI